jgi:hypothetical protein
MKISHDFPYTFFDLRKEIENILECNIEKKDVIELKIELPEEVKYEGVHYAIEVECSQTFFREMNQIIDLKLNLFIEKKLIGDSFDYNILMIAGEDGEIIIQDHKETYEKGDIIGLLDKNTIYLRNQNVFSGIIKVSKSKHEEIIYDLSNDWITIMLPELHYEKFVIWQKDESSTPFALASLGQTSLQFALLSAIKDENLKEKKWYKIILTEIQNTLEIEEPSEEQIPDITNYILGDCLNLMLDKVLPIADFDDTSILA